MFRSIGRINALRCLKSPQSIRSVSSTVHIHGLPVTVQREELQTVCGEFGTIITLFFVQARSGKHSIATLTFKHIESAIAIVDELHDSFLWGRKVKVIFSKKIELQSNRKLSQSHNRK